MEQNNVSLKRFRLANATLVIALLVFAVFKSSHGEPNANPPEAAPISPPSEQSVELSPSQLNSIQIAPVGTASFAVEKEAVGNIAFDDNLSVQVFPQYPGKIVQTFAELGDDVKKGQPLYSIASPDLIQAESTLITAAGALNLADKALARVKDLYGTNGVSQRDMEQAASDQQAAQGAFAAARDNVRLFGKTDAEIDQIIAQRKIDPALVVRSPLQGQVTMKSAPPGLLAQPGNATAPYSVADLSTKWMLACVAENESGLCRMGEPVEVKVMADSGHVFKGKIAKVYPSLDPTTHRLMVRSEIEDKAGELRPGMLATFTIQVQAPVQSTSIPFNGVVRNGDGTFSAWVTTDRRHFAQRMVKIGLQNESQYEVLEGLRPGELAVIDGAIFLSNMLEAPPTD